MKHRKEALQLLADGYTVSQVAGELKMSKFYLVKMLKEWREQSGADTSCQLIAMTLRRREIG